MLRFVQNLLSSLFEKLPFSFKNYLTSEQQKTDKNFLIFESQFSPNIDENQRLLHMRTIHLLWSGHFALFNNGSDGGYWNFVAFDFLMNEECPIRFPKSGHQFYYVNITALCNKFFFICENSATTRRINLVYINWNTKEFELVERFERHRQFPYIFVDKMQPSKFLLIWSQNFGLYNYQICRVLNGEKIEFGEIHQVESFYKHWFDDEFVTILPSKMLSYKLSTKKMNLTQIDRSTLPSNTRLAGNSEQIDDRFYMSLFYMNIKVGGIVWVDFKTKRWNLLNVETGLYIKNLKCFNNNSLLVFTRYCVVNDPNGSKLKIYNIPIRKPNFLRYSAWRLVVKMMKKKSKKNPYEAAKEYLPLNSDLRPYWFKNKEKTVELIER